MIYNFIVILLHNFITMNQLKGTIYLRDNAWYKMENVIKMGIATFAKDRSNTYITGEVERGEYIYVIEIPLDKMKIIDKCLKHYFKSFHIYKGGGTEFYDRCIIDLIEPYFKNINIPYTILTKEEINLMNRCERVRNISNVDKFKKAFNHDFENILSLEKFRQEIFHEDNFNRSCHYCNISESEIEVLCNDGKIKTKRIYSRGRTMEVDQVEPAAGYGIENIKLCCYWCNNAKTDEFTATEFKAIASAISTVWKNRTSST